VLAGDDLGELVLAGVEQLAKREQDLGALCQRSVPPFVFDFTLKMFAFELCEALQRAGLELSGHDIAIIVAEDSGIGEDHSACLV